MLTQCPNCRARTKLSDDHARARVRCSECGRVFVARADDAAAVPGRASLGLYLGAVAGVLALIVLAVFLRAGDENGPPDGPASAPAPASK